MRPEGPGPRRGRIAPLGSVIESMQRRAPGRELDADLFFMDGRQVYRILWVTAHGRRMDVIVDAETGALLSER